MVDDDCPQCPQCGSKYGEKRTVTEKGGTEARIPAWAKTYCVDFPYGEDGERWRYMFENGVELTET